MDTAFAAHINDQGGFHRLEDHLTQVGKRSAAFAKEFQSDQWAELAGRWHDLGKYSAAFQDMIRSANGIDAHVESEAPQSGGKVNHSSAGALYAVEKLSIHGRLLAYLIAGHHAGLPDWYKLDTPGGALHERLADKRLLADARQADIPEEILSGAVPDQPYLGGSDGFALWARMLFSALVDADFLDTEAFYDKEKSSRRGAYRSLAEMKALFDVHMLSMLQTVDDTPINRLRAKVLADCREAACKSCGIFSLTVPTGGGKTLSSLAFALEHAVAHGKRRIIYAIPYTSIIEQTAGVFRDVFGDEVIEHHSNFDFDKEDHQSRLATENWDASLIVTTNVQFFESLFAARTSRCRKLHNIVNSVVVLDEAQLLPPEFLNPILKVMNLLAVHYGVTFVLSTATQPALNTLRNGFGQTILEGLDQVREIIPDPDSLFQGLERVTVTLPDNFHQPQPWSHIARQMQAHDSVLTVVNTRKDARALYKALPAGTIHLSALMCGEHRSRVIAEIKRRLDAKEPTRVVSTQLVEAGVDLDFPVVYRAWAGLDSMAQAAGRCNREGRLNGKGRVIVFVPPAPPPPGPLLRAAQKTVSLLSGSAGNPLDRKNFTRFFEHFYADTDLDKHGIRALLQPEGDLSNVQFRTAAAKMKLIQTKDVTVLVPYEKGEALIGQLEKQDPHRSLLRKLQRYAVNVPEYWFERMRASGDISELKSGLFALASPVLYHPELGLLMEQEPIHPENLVC